MPETLFRTPSRTVATTLVLAGLLGGCSAVQGAAELTGLATKPAEPKPFVLETRPQDPRYVPVGTTISRDAKRKTVEEFKKLEAELEAKRLSNVAAGTQAQSLGNTPPPAPAKLPTD
ncbi:hypothetical protein [Bosea sp. (in: a-proteobacteria)]|uniref:hypothetical protein n=1 Tax=Bosea sp. (in: a-proteobacteria) TaxID=1871050 RepID=UPI002FC95992